MFTRLIISSDDYVRQDHENSLQSTLLASPPLEADAWLAVGRRPLGSERVMNRTAGAT